ncbi:HD domain-containing protein [Thermoleophilia bacterium SCSIO 60948]|nr:HD domain-containing protein [Thermoleophilia bacterium SCSIO 60948]
MRAGAYSNPAGEPGTAALGGAAVLPLPPNDPSQRAARRLARLLDRHAGLREHGESVGALSAAVARRLGASEDDALDIELAGRLHDIGKAVIEVGVIEKPGPLGPRELARIKRHPLDGARMLRAAGLERIATWVLCHHERPDGRGYPIGLSRREIPAQSLILSAADACDAMLSDRAYRPAIGLGAAIAELERGVGRQFDGEVVEALLCELPRLESELSAAGLEAAAR